jgi:iron complex transport system substrate-binding protein
VRLRGFAAAVGLLAISFAVFAEPSYRDDLGRTVASVGTGKRIVALSPFITEAVYAAGAGAELVGVSEYSDYPEPAKRLPPVSGALGVEWEKLAALKPDLAFAWKDTLRDNDLERFAQLRIPVFVLSGRRLDDIPRTLRAVAAMTGRPPPAAAMSFELRMTKVRVANAKKPRVTVLLEIQHRPLMTIAGPHFMNDALAACGADNVFANLPGVAPEVSWEQLMARDPQAIVGAGALENEKDFRDRWKDHPTLRAVKTGALIYVNGDHFYRPTARLAEGIESLCSKVDEVRRSFSK